MKPDTETLPLPLDTPLRPGADPMLTIEEASSFSDIPERTLRDGCDKSRYPGAVKDPSGAWRIPHSALPHLAQARYWAKHRAEAPGGWPEEDRRELSEQGAADLWRRYEGKSLKLKDKAKQKAEAMHLWQALTAEGLPQLEKLARMKSQYGMGKGTVYDNLELVRGYEPMHWPALLVGKWEGQNAKRVEWPAGSWHFFMTHVLVPGAKVKTAYNRTQRQAEAQGWGKLPSYETALADFKRLPSDVVTLAKEGETALKAKSPTLRRDYESMALHELWSLDGRRLDLMVRDTKGKYGPAGRVFRLWMYALMDVRSRYLVGYTLGDALTADLVRNAFLNALKTTGRIIPRGIQADNGMEIAAKENSGGATWRRRGKVLEDEIIGIFPLLEIPISWANVAHGQSKPVERLFGTLANMVETRPEFRGAYCGNSPEARPEEWDAAKAVDVETLESILREEIAAYHKAPHRGHAMHGKSPMQVYSELMTSGQAVRKISEEQARVCTLSAAPITILKNGGFTLLGAPYYSIETAALPVGKGYYARYNPEDLSDEVFVCKREKIVARARKTERTGWNDKAAAQQNAKDRRNYTKQVKKALEALRTVQAADTPESLANLRREVMGDSGDIENGEILPAGKVLEIVKTAAEVPTDKRTPEQEERATLKAEAARLQQEQGDGLSRIMARKRLGL